MGGKGKQKKKEPKPVKRVQITTEPPETTKRARADKASEIDNSQNSSYRQTQIASSNHMQLRSSVLPSRAEISAQDSWGNNRNSTRPSFSVKSESNTKFRQKIPTEHDKTTAKNVTQPVIDQLNLGMQAPVV
jgi:hypothetical protein